MRLVEFLIALLEAHSEALKRLAALFGEENLVQLLEMAGDSEERAFDLRELTRPELFENPPSSHYSDGTPYAQIEGSVRDFNLPSVLEFHLWTYPIYRAYIESPLDLNSRIPGPGGNAGSALVDDAVAFAERWVRSLPMSERVKDQASRAAEVPWLRFRASVLKKTGRRPLGPVY